MNQNQLAHSLWKKHLLSKIGENLCIVDATCGNGHDSLFLSGFENFELHCIDIQEEAIKQTKTRLSLKNNNIYYHLKSHENLDFIKKPIDLITYNLGYLPGSDKKIKTLSETTIKSLRSALNKLAPFGMISLMIYTGHQEGQTEKASIIEFISKLDKKFEISIFTNPSKIACPELLLINSLL
jgi:SAM-dependent methyltransferase